MCGIAGIYNFDKRSVESYVIHRMNNVMVHRGPDGQGEHLEENIGLANRRLAIIDPTTAGNQPMATADGTLWITFNGEIFNFEKLKKDLIGRGYHFRSHTDTEVVLNGYREYGHMFVKKLIGQFAFCIWDRRQSRFILARDQLGVNPLYWTRIGNAFIFASELKAILASGLVKKEINPEALHHYLSIFSIPSPMTIIKGVNSLLPGRVMTVDKGGVRIEKYWELPVGLWQNKNISEGEEIEELKSQLVSAVSYAKVSDVPVGAYLSGGVDSSTVVALLSMSQTKPVRTYSLWSEGGEAYDERKYASLVAKRYGTVHTEFTVSQSDLISSLPEIIYYFDQPTGGSLETYFISRLAAKDVKVALSGLGGDELFAGYHSELYNTKSIGDIYNHIPPALRSLLFLLMKRIAFRSDWKKVLSVSQDFFNLPTLVRRSLYLYFAYQEEEKKNLYSKSYLSLQKGSYSTQSYFEGLYQKIKGWHPVDQLNYIDLKSYTRDDLLLGMNMMSMANSLEARVPLLDPRLVEFSARIHPSRKYRDGISKYILKKAVADWLPKEVVNHKKTGFAIPRVIYMKGILKPYIKSVLSPESLKNRGIFNDKYITEVVNKFYGSKQGKMLWSEHLRVWILFVFELWCRIYLDNTKIAKPAVTLDDLAI
ncbi:asparagine synthase (glutamine-hydrolyzing) [Patescibacteria group bacterium]|nr:asparagine synthase (glutamine-hydrolyzing) [Patescibacteria group bacterium]